MKISATNHSGLVSVLNSTPASSFMIFARDFHISSRKVIVQKIL